ncbi:MAG: recombinase family protein [Armatimonadota bacterium]|jgi:site-specific DNA recombinase
MLMVGIYARVSTEEQVGPEGSIKNQLQRCKQYLDLQFGPSSENGYALIERYQEEGKSGKNTEERPVFQKMLADIHNGTINAICVAELSRLSRSVKDIANILSDFEKNNITFLCLNPSVDTSTAAGKLVLNVMAALAEYEREQTAARTKAAMYDRAQRGLWNGGHIFGYDLDPDNQGHLTVNEEQAEVVRKIFETYLKEKSIQRTVDKINEAGHRLPGYTSRRGKEHPERKFAYSTLQTMLKNRAYLGEKEINKKNKGEDQSELDENKQYEIVDAVWPAIIEEELFRSVQIAMAQNTRSFVRGKRDHTFLLSDMVECGHCNVSLENGSGTGRGGKRYYYYRHTTGTKKDDCPIGDLSASELEDAIVERLREIAENEGIVERACERANEGRVTEAEELEKEIERLRNRKAEEEEKLSALMDSIAEVGHLGPIKQQLKERSDSIQELERAIETKQARREALEKAKSNPKQMKANLKEFAEAMDDLDVVDRVNVMRLMVKMVRLHEDSVELELYDHDTEIGQWIRENSEGGKWFSGELDWLPGPDSNQQPNG